MRRVRSDQTRHGTRRRRCRRAFARERTLLRSLGAARRASKFDHLMLGALRTWPHDVEVQFMWIKRLTTRSIRSLGAPSELDRAQAQAMLDDMLRFQSLTPIQRARHAHYEIHAWDDTLRPESALFVLPSCCSATPSKRRISCT
jgi:hypothetical protein